MALVRRCIECDVILVEQKSPDGQDAPSPTATPINDGDEVAYELEGWSNQLKVSLEGMLVNAGIRRVWEAAVLVVPAEFEEQVDALIATVEGADLEELDVDEDQIAFDVEVLNSEELEDLDARLYASGIAHSWTDDLELLVSESDADSVEEIISTVLDGDQDDNGGDGLAVQSYLSKLYVSVDKLTKNPSDTKLVSRFRDASEDVSTIGVPYGMSGSDWASLLAMVETLRRLVGNRPEDQSVEADKDEQAPDTEPSDSQTPDEDVPAEGSDAPDDGTDGLDEEPDVRELTAQLRERLRELV